MRIYKTTAERLREAADEMEKLREENAELRNENMSLKARLSLALKEAKENE